MKVEIGNADEYYIEAMAISGPDVLGFWKSDGDGLRIELDPEDVATLTIMIRRKVNGDGPYPLQE